jgi:alginate O-acetyltransferase complex protein AlgI
MLFNSLQFLLFFPLTTILYYLLPHKYRWAFMLLASCIFYCAFIPIYILILFFTIIIDYTAGIYIEKNEGTRRKWFLILSIIANLGTLCMFKYYNFFIDNVNGLFHNVFHMQGDLPFLNIILPIGLSFHTFQAMSYTIEVYRGNQKVEKHLGIYALYVMFYPQLVAGPIERPQHILHQLHEEHPLRYENIIIGLKIMLMGYFKKAVVADRLAVFTDPIFNHPKDYPAEMLVIATVFFSIQLFCDFSGYSDIAVGTARVLGIQLMQNFNNPYKSQNITEFWRRWHISLSSWLNDYLFTPIAISKRDWGKWGVVYSMIITFTLIGLWHGANWTYVLFGLFHGIAVAFEFLTKSLRKSISKITPTFIYVSVSIFLTFLFWNFTQIFFRALNVEQAIYIVRLMPSGIIHLPRFFMHMHSYLPALRITNVEFLVSLLVIFIILSADFLQSKKSIRLMIDRRPFLLRWSLYYSIVLIIIVLGVFENRQFIYFQF